MFDKTNVKQLSDRLGGHNKRLMELEDGVNFQLSNLSSSYGEYRPLTKEVTAREVIEALLREWELYLVYVDGRVEVREKK